MIGGVGGLRRLALNVEPLRDHRDFRFVLASQVIANLGIQMTLVALPYQVYVTTDSAFALGALAAMQLSAILLFSLVGGAIADSVDKRTLLFITQAGMGTAVALLTGLALAGSTAIWPLYLLAFVSAVFQSVDRPARQAMVPRLVSRPNLSAALALNHIGLQAGHMVGPAVAGLLIASVGVVAAYGINTVAFLISVIALMLIAPIPPAVQAAARPSWRTVLEGVRYVRRAPVLLAAFCMDLNGMILGLPTAIYPVMALTVFDAGPTGLGLLVAAPAVGGVVGLLSSGWLNRMRYQGRAVIGAIAVWGVAITAFGLTTYLPLALVFLCIAGAANSIGTVARWTIMQLSSPDHLRGRVAALNAMVVSSGPRIGDIRVTSMAELLSAQISVVSGGILSLLGLVWIVRAFPHLAAYDTQAPIEDGEERSEEAPARELLAKH